jgi:AraC family transcriptional regulator, arabinose operon regulatory protein
LGIEGLTKNMSFFTDTPTTKTRHLLIQMAEESLQFEYQSGDITPVAYPLSTGWRTLSALLIAHLDATAKLEIRNQPLKNIRRGQVHLVPPGIYHVIRMTHKWAGFSTWSHVNFTICSTIQITSLLSLPDIISGKNAEKIRDINGELALLAKEKDPSLHHVFRRKMLAFQLLYLITEKATLAAGTFENLKNIERIAPALTYLKENFNRNIEPTTLAATVGLSPSRFHAVFQNAIGQSPGRHLQKLRLQHAGQILHGPGTVGEIAQASGYHDLFHFSRLFKKHYGMSPSAYRKQTTRGF